jgi:hypothetical protein
MPVELSFEERLRVAERHDSKAERSKVAAWKGMVNDYMKESPSNAKQVFDYVQAQRKKSAPSAESDEPLMSSGKAAILDSTWRPSYTRLNNSSSKCLKACLQMCDRVVFSEGNLRALCVKGQRDPPNTVLAPYVTYCTDLREDILIKESDRDTDIMVQKCKDNCKPARLVDFLLPRDIDNTQGLYSAIDRRGDGGGVLLELAFEKERGQVKVPRDFTGSLYFENNFSLARAVLRDHGGIAHSLFPF